MSTEANTPETPDSSAFYTKLLQRALEEIDERLQGKAILVSTQMRVDGEKRILDENIRTLHRIINVLRTQGESVFDQVPWLDINQEGAPQDYAKKFEIFWRGLIASGRISKIIVPSESRGTRGVEAEIAYAVENKIEVIQRDLADLLSGKES
jgi:hypothetical protein